MTISLRSRRLLLCRDVATSSTSSDSSCSDEFKKLRWSTPLHKRHNAGNRETIEERDFLGHHHHRQHLVADLQQKQQQQNNPSVFLTVDDSTSASSAIKLLSATRRKKNAETTFLVYRGDYHNARQLLSAMKRRVKLPRNTKLKTITDQWNAQRRLVIEQANIMNRLLVQVDGKCHNLQNLRRAPSDVSHILQSAYGKLRTSSSPYVIPLREILGRIGAQQWYEKGVYVPHLNDYIYPHYGVFAPIRQEYLDLIVKAPITNFGLPSLEERSSSVVTMMDVGIGTGIISAIMMMKTSHNKVIRRVIGTDVNPQAIACARDNLSRLGLLGQTELLQTNIFPEDGNNITDRYKADLIVCNPPWLPGTSSSWIDRGVYDDEEMSFLRGFLLNVHNYLKGDNSEIWLIMSDMAELLGLRTRETLLNMIDSGNLYVMDVSRTSPTHPKARGVGHLSGGPSDETMFDKVAAARSAETIGLYRLRPKTIRPS